MSELQHPDSRAFELVADLYERARPGYPPAAIRWLADRLDLREGRVVLDLGAGTGKLTRALVATGAQVIAVEPGEAMLAQLRRAVPGAEAALGAAEAIPLPDASVDALTVGQAFHWFRHDEAIPELHRVLRPGGRVGLIWNSRDQSSPLQREVNELLESLVRPPRAHVRHSSRYLAESDLFTSVEERSFSFVQELDADALVERIGSISFVAASSEDEQRRVERELRELAVENGGTVAFPYVTEVYVTRAE